MGLDDSDPILIEARAELEKAEQAMVEEAKASDFDDTSRGRTLRDFVEHRAQEEFADPDGTIDFGRMVDEDPTMAEHWLVNNLLPHVQEGRYAGIDTIPMDVARKRRLTKEGKTSLLTLVDNVILSSARARDLANSEVQLRMGDKTYSIMQLLAEMMDSGQFMSQGRLNGRNFMTLHGLAKGLESEVIRPIAILDDTLRVEVAKEQGRLRSRISRSMAAADGVVSQRQQELRRLAGQLLLPKDTALYKEAKATFEGLPNNLKHVVGEMSDAFKISSDRTKRDAVFAKLIGTSRAKESGVMPIRLKPEHLANKATTFGPALAATYGSSMVQASRMKGIFDLDSLIGAGLIPSPDKIRNSIKLAEELRALAREGLLDTAEINRMERAGELDRLLDDMKSGKSKEVRNSRLFTRSAHTKYENAVLNGDYSPEGNVFISRRFQHELDRSESASMKVYHLSLIHI